MKRVKSELGVVAVENLGLGHCRDGLGGLQSTRPLARTIEARLHPRHHDLPVPQARSVHSTLQLFGLEAVAAGLLRYIYHYLAHRRPSIILLHLA